MIELDTLFVSSGGNSGAPAMQGTIKEFRWDKGDRYQYYLESGALLSRISHLCLHGL